MRPEPPEDRPPALHQPLAERLPLGLQPIARHAVGRSIQGRVEDIARPSPLKHKNLNLNLLGRYSFASSIPAAGTLRPLRDPDASKWMRTTPNRTKQSSHPPSTPA